MVIVSMALQDGQNEDNEARLFKMHLSELQYHLERCPVHNAQERLSFVSLVVERNLKTSEQIVYRNFVYRVEFNAGNRKQLTTAIVNPKGAARFTLIQTNGYDLAEMEASPGFKALTPELKAKTRICYQAVNPRKPVCLLAGTGEESIEIGTFRFVNDSELIAKAVITVIYSLRNSLFHGQIVPDKETQRVYEPAYHVLCSLVEGLG
jgi:hypothetical protein